MCCVSSEPCPKIHSGGVEAICIAIRPAEIRPHITSAAQTQVTLSFFLKSANLGSRVNPLINRLHLMCTLFSCAPSIPRSGNLNIE